MKKKIILLFLTLLSLVSFLGFVSPNSARLPVYLVIFSLVYVVFALVFSLVIDLAYARLPKSRRRFAAIILGFSPTIILALTSLSSVSVVDFTLAIAIPVVIVWYGLRGTIIK